MVTNGFRGLHARPYTICARCIMDTSDPYIQFDENGHCNHCRTYDVRFATEVFPGEEGRRRLKAIVAKIKADGRGREYDCLIGVSGGVDSTTVAYWVRKLGLRPLAVHLDNGWNSELATRNMKRMAEALELDMMTHVVDWPSFRDLQLSFLKASVPNCEIPTDHAINALMLETAARYGIKYIIGGGNVATEGILPAAWGYYNQDLRHIKAIHRRFGTVPLTNYPQLPLRRFVSLVLLSGIRIIPILNYVDYRRSQAVELIQRELGWEPYGGKHYESVYTRFFQGYILPRKFGYDKRRAHLSTLICAGDMSREEALAEMEQDPYSGNDLQADMEEVLEKLGLSPSDFRRVMETPPRRHQDYPSNRFFFDGLAGLRKQFKKIATRA